MASLLVPDSLSGVALYVIRCARGLRLSPSTSAAKTCPFAPYFHSYLSFKSQATGASVRFRVKMWAGGCQGGHSFSDFLLWRISVQFCTITYTDLALKLMALPSFVIREIHAMQIVVLWMIWPDNRAEAGHTFWPCQIKHSCPCALNNPAPFF